MRPLHHPSANEVRLTHVLFAMADPTRLAILRALAAEEGPINCIRLMEIAGKKIAKSTLSQHFKILRESGLIRSERCGVALENLIRLEELDARFDGLVSRILEVASHEKTGKRPRRKA